MLRDLLNIGRNALGLAQTWEKCWKTCSNLGEMLSDLLRLGENPLRLAKTRNPHVRAFLPSVRKSASIFPTSEQV